MKRLFYLITLLIFTSCAESENVSPDNKGGTKGNSKILVELKDTSFYTTDFWSDTLIYDDCISIEDDDYYDSFTYPCEHIKLQIDYWCERIHRRKNFFEYYTADYDSIYPKPTFDKWKRKKRIFFDEQKSIATRKCQFKNYCRWHYDDHYGTD